MNLFQPPVKRVGCGWGVANPLISSTDFVNADSSARRAAAASQTIDRS
jgi:hypothetical protein